MGLFDRLRSLVGRGSDDDAETTGSQDDAGETAEDSDRSDATSGVDSPPADRDSADAQPQGDDADTVSGGDDRSTADGSVAAAGDDVGASEDAEDDEPISWEDTGFEQLTPEEEETGFEQLASELTDEEADERSEGETTDGEQSGADGEAGGVDDLITEAEAGGADAAVTDDTGGPDGTTDPAAADADSDAVAGGTETADTGPTPDDAGTATVDTGTETVDSGSDDTPGDSGEMRLPLDDGPAVGGDDGPGGDIDVPEEGPRAEFVADARDLAEFWGEYDLDFTVESLARVDEYLDDQWGPERFADVEFGGEDYDSAVFTEQVHQVGGYLGEVLVRNGDGEWAEREGVGWLVALGADADPVPVFHLVQECLIGDATVASTVVAVLDARES